MGNNRGRKMGLFPFSRYREKFQAHCIMHQMHAEALEIFARPVENIPECAINIKRRMDFDAAVWLWGHNSPKTNKSGMPLMVSSAVAVPLGAS